tara:strand:- start:1014 stop:3068 length:2055 start_codon:yes stop_codon:yes gene_type:complete
MRGAVLLILGLVICPLGPVFASSDIMGVANESPLAHLDGSGVVIAVADTGIDMDHSCFRNSTENVGVPGEDHRKILHLNDSVDGWDTQGHQQFRHGTHIAGVLACSHIDGTNESVSLSSGAKLVVQDIVGSNGWEAPEDVTTLLAESARFGAVINSWSWGDNTEDYTERSRMIDEWTYENPWSLVFVAPGNTGNTMLEPANAYNVVSVVASDSDENASLWPGNSHGPDVNNRRGTFVAAPGMNVLSAKADGVENSLNNGSYKMTGTSVAAPMAASFTALLQQMIEEDYGYTPSAPMLRAMLAASAEGIGSNQPDEMQGYGRPDLSSFENGYFAHDSYFSEDWKSIIDSRGGSISSLLSNPWDGSEAVGPFLSENESWSKFFYPLPNEDVEVVLSYNARPGEYEIDDLRLIVHTSEGKFAIDDSIRSSGYSQLYYSSVANPLNLNSTNETTVMVRLSASQLESVEWLRIEVVANSVHEGSNPGTLGINGTKLGFGLAATGVQELYQNTAPIVSIINGPSGGENYSENISLNLSVTDFEGDGYAVVLRLNNSNFSIDLSDCALVSSTVSNINCNINIVQDLVPRPINRNDWRLEILAADDNSSVWTTPMMSTYTSNNFSIWWTSPMLDEINEERPIVNEGKTEQNRVLLWGVFGVIVGVIVASGVMFRGFEKRIFSEVPSPFREEE